MLPKLSDMIGEMSRMTEPTETESTENAEDESNKRTPAKILRLVADIAGPLLAIDPTRQDQIDAVGRFLQSLSFEFSFICHYIDAMPVMDAMFQIFNSKTIFLSKH
jgi:hypothetical protein